MTTERFLDGGDEMENLAYSPEDEGDPSLATGAVEKVEDPFSPENAPAFTLITLMRIYDVLMAQLNEGNPTAAMKLMDLHAKGKLLGSFPWLDPEE